MAHARAWMTPGSMRRSSSPRPSPCPMSTICCLPELSLVCYGWPSPLAPRTAKESRCWLIPGTPRASKGFRFSVTSIHRAISIYPPATHFSGSCVSIRLDSTIPLRLCACEWLRLHGHSREWRDRYLVNGLKFSFRLYVVCTDIDPLRLYVYDEAYVYFSGQPFSRGRGSGALAGHITNRGFSGRDLEQVFPTDIEESSEDATEVDSSTRTLSAFRAYLRDAKGVDDEAWWMEVKAVIFKTYAALLPRLRKSCVSAVTRSSCSASRARSIVCLALVNGWLAGR
jgi:hypothetical protein